MKYEIFRYIFMGGAILSGVMFIISVLLFVFLKIPRIIGDLSGATAKKAIEDIRKQNENTGAKTYKSSYVNNQRGKLTDKISPSGSLVKNASLDAGAMATEKISTDDLGTEVLSSNETTVLDYGADETTLLNETGENETTVLSQTEEEQPVFVVEYDITFIHTDEVIV